MSVASVVRKMWEVSRAERLDPEQVQTLRRRRLQKLLRYVLAHSRFYAEYYRAHGITAGVLDEVRLTDLPPVNKDMVMANFDELVCDPALTQASAGEFLADPAHGNARYRGGHRIVHTSGSTGAPAIFVYGRWDWDLLQALVGTRVLRYRLTVGRIRCAFIVKTDGLYGGITLCQGAPGIAFRRLALSIQAPLEQTLAEVQRFQPHLLGGYGSALYILARRQLAGQIRIKPARVISSGEPLTEEMTQTLATAFGVMPTDFYAASESLALGASCPYHQGIHLFDDWHGIELVDPAGRPVGPGRSGRVVLTNLYNYTLPLIRYEMNDEVVPAAGPCPCGWPFPLVRQIAGRTEETLWFDRPDGTKEYLHPGLIIGLHLPGAQGWQLVQTTPRELLLRFTATHDAETVARRARAELTALLHGKRLDRFITARVELVNEIRSDPHTGKRRLVIPYDRACHGAAAVAPARE
jgi:phenylacetate-CoA ligase